MERAKIVTRYTMNEDPAFNCGELPQIEDLERKALVRDWNTVRCKRSLPVAGPLHRPKNLFEVAPDVPSIRPR